MSTLRDAGQAADSGGRAGDSEQLAILRRGGLLNLHAYG